MAIMAILDFVKLKALNPIKRKLLQYSFSFLDLARALHQLAKPLLPWLSCDSFN